MSPPSPGRTDTRPAPGPVGWLLTLAGTGLLALGLFSPAQEVADPRLDPSNYVSYAYFTARDFAYGKEVMPMAGPLGFVPYGFVYGGQLFWKRLSLELLTKLVFAVLIVRFLRRAHTQPVLRWFWLATMLVMVPPIHDLAYDLAVLLAALALVELHPDRQRRALAAVCGLAAYLAMLTLFKGTQAILALVTLGLLGVQAMHLRDFRRLPWIAGTYVLTLAGLLTVTGQNPMHYLLYWRGMLELSSGYNLAMGLDETRAVFLGGVGAVFALMALVLVTLLSRWRQPAALSGGLLLAGFTFIEWKHGYVRADGHVFIFLHYAAVAAPTILLFAGSSSAMSRLGRSLVAGLSLAAFGLGFWGFGISSPVRHPWSVRQWWERLPHSLRQIATPTADKARLDAALTRQRRTYELPRVKELVGTERIDFFGTEQGYLMLNGLNYRPRPMGGGTFNVFTPWLQNLNTNYLANPLTRPSYYLVNPETIDHRFLAQDDPGTLRALLSLYTPVASEQGMTLFQARSGSPELPPSRFLGTRGVTLGEAVQVPEVGAHEVLQVSFTLPLNLIGRIRSFLYKPPMLFMGLEGEGLVEPDQRRLVPNLVRNAVQLSPALENMRDVLALYQDIPGKTVRRFTLQSPQPGLWRSVGLEAHFYAAPRPSPSPLATPLLQALDFPVANSPPLAVNPPNAASRRFDGLPVLMLDPPGFIRFALTGTEREVDFKFGIDAEAYQRGQTDGVDFIVDLERPGQEPQALFRRLLRPRLQPPDRGTQMQRLVLPPFPPGSTLALRTEAGPDRDGAWDWGYYTGIRLITGAYRPQQFPRFARVPLMVEAATAGALLIEGRELFMLNPPGSLTFTMTGVEREFTFVAGLLPGAYTGSGRSDGVEFLIDLRAPDGTVISLSRQWLNPRDHETDRGDRSCVVPLPPVAPGTQLILSVTPGPAGNGAWDWAYVESVQFD